MRKIVWLANLVIVSASVQGMDNSEQRERKFSENMVAISELSRKNESIVASNETSTWWSNGLRNVSEFLKKTVAIWWSNGLGNESAKFIKKIEEKKKKCKGREQEISTFNAKDSKGQNILMYAVKNANLEIVRLLLDMNVIDLNAKDNNGNTALLIATQVGDIEKMRLLLSRGADVVAQNNDKETALLIAVKSKDNEKIELLIKYNALSKNNLNSFDEIVINRYQMDLSLIKKQIGAIRRKVEKELQELTQTMISCGKSEKSRSKFKEALNNWKEVNAPITEEGLTPLMYAAMNDKRSITEVLLTFKDIDVNAQWKGNNGTALSLAAVKGYGEIVDLLLSHKDIQINLANKNGLTPLSYAIFRKQGSIAKKLIKHGADVNCQDEHGNSPIMNALSFGLVDILEELINAGADLNLTNKNGRTPLMFLVTKISAEKINGKVVSSDCILEMLKILLRQNNINVNTQDNDGNTTLIIAAGEGQIKVVNELIKCKKVKLNIVNNKGNNAIMEAIQNDRKNVVQELLKQEYFRKNINYKNKEGRSLLLIAAIEGYTGLANLLLKQKDDKGNLIVDVNVQNKYGNTPLMAALCNNYLAIVNRLLDQDKIDVTLEDQFRQTSLTLSVYKGIYSITKKILERTPTDLLKTYVNVKSLNQVTAMAAAVYSNNAKMVDLLLKHGADVNTKFEDETMLMFAARNGFTEIVKLLLDAGADVNIRNNAKETALDIVKELDFRNEIIQLLQNAEPEFPQLGLSVKEVNKRFKKAVENKSAKDVDQLLHQYNNGNMVVSNESINEMFVKAAGSGSEEIFNLLLPYVKDFNFKDKNGNTALMAAAKNGQAFVVSTLLKYSGRIDINAENKENYTALMMAVEKGYRSIVRELLNEGAKISNSINREAALSIISSAKANMKNNKSVIATYEKIEKWLKEKRQQQDNKLVVSIGFWPVYAGNEFCKQLEELDRDFPDLGKKVRKIILRLSVNPNYKSDKDDNPEAWNFGCYSRRLNEKHRLVYRLQGGVVQCLFCKDHNTKLERADKSVIDKMVCKYKWEQDENGEYSLVKLDREDRITLKDISSVSDGTVSKKLNNKKSRTLKKKKRK